VTYYTALKAMAIGAILVGVVCMLVAAIRLQRRKPPLPQEIDSILHDEESDTRFKKLR
jgi:hypothetical protein